MAWVDGLLLDIDGVLTVSWKAIDGAPEALAELREREIPMRFVTNTTTRVRSDIASLLNDAGFDIAAEQILTARTATASYLRHHHPAAKCFVLSTGNVTPDLEGVTLVDHDSPAEVFVIGGAGLIFTHEELNHAFRLLLEDAAFVAMHRNMYWMTSGGMELDTGAYVRALEEASGVSPVVVGKPSAAFFESGLDALGLPPIEWRWWATTSKTTCSVLSRPGCTEFLCAPANTEPRP